MLYPPMLLTPMAARLGDYYLTTGKPAEAVDAYQRALKAFPNDLTTMAGLQKAYTANGNAEHAQETGGRIEEVRKK